MLLIIHFDPSWGQWVLTLAAVVAAAAAGACGIGGLALLGRGGEAVGGRDVCVQGPVARGGCEDKGPLGVPGRESPVLGGLPLVAALGVCATALF